MKFPNEILLPEVCEMVAQGHTVTIRVNGQSMRPMLRDGRDDVVLSRVGKPRKGDLVLACLAPGQYVLHRIIRIGKDGTITLLGDGNLTPEICSADDRKAVAVAVIRRGKRLRSDGVVWRVYGFVWMALRPVRRYLLAACRLAGK